jgi:hypothetical protein
MEAAYSPNIAESKDMLEPECMKAVENLQAYQNEMSAWRDKKVNLKHIEAGDLVLLQSPHTEASEKLEPKWIGPFHGNRENKTRVSSLSKQRRKGAGAHFEC